MILSLDETTSVIGNNATEREHSDLRNDIRVANSI